MLETLQKLLQDPVFKNEVKNSIKTFKANDKILQEGEPHQDFYFIIQGTARVFMKGDIGEQQPIHPGIAELNPGDFFGEFALIDQTPASADVIAKDELEVQAINIDSFLTFLNHHPDVGYVIYKKILEMLVNRLRKSNKKVIQLLIWGIKSHHLDEHL